VPKPSALEAPLAQSVVCCHSPVLEQAILADFIAEGHFARHLGRMRVLYGERQSILVESIGAELGGLLDLGAADAGLQLAACLPRGTEDSAASKMAAMPVFTTPLSSCDLMPNSQPGLLLGYAALTPTQIRAGAKALAKGLFDLAS
jgi:GntR family transcriptional regulator / MocR family aminotransferase